MLFLLLFLVGEIREGGKVEHQIVLPLNHLNRSYGRSGFINVGVCVFLVEVGRVRLAHQRRLPRRRDLLVLQRLPVQPVEERVRLDVLRVARTGAQTQLWVANQQARDEVGRFGGEEALHMGAHDGAYGELQRRVENVREHHLPVLVVEGRLPHSRLASLPVLRSSRREASPRSTSRPRGRRGVPAAPPAPRTPACLRWS